MTTALLLGTLLAAQDALPESLAEDVLAGLRPDHPRLILTEERVAELVALAGHDPLLAKAMGEVRGRADDHLDAPALEHVLQGPRLLAVSRACLDRVYALGLQWRLTGEVRYARAVRDNLLTVCAFPDWNPSHFLDTAEMAHAVGVGYDWCFAALSAEERATIRAGLIEKGLEPGLRAYTAARPAWWTTSAFNWNQVCNGGLLAGALAVAETDADLARTIVSHAVRSLPAALATYEPDGAWGEGPGYWAYATNYTVYGLAALRTALGHDFGLSGRAGLARAGFFPISACGPTGLYVAYADVGERARRRGLPALFWLAARYQEPALAAAEREWIAQERADPRHVLWYVPGDGDQAFTPPLDQLFRGPVELALLRSASGDPEALFVALKGGYNAVNHGHLDLGNFELDALGVRWARDLGSDDYNLPGYWDGKEGGRRWGYYRLGSHSHSVLTLDGRQQAVAARAGFVDFQSRPDHAHAVVEIRDAWPGRAAEVRRGVALTDGRTAVEIQDELLILEDCELVWGMTTDAEIECLGGTAVLRLDGRACRVTLEAPAGATFSVESAERAPPERANQGVGRLVIRHPVERGPLRIHVRLDGFRRGDTPAEPSAPARAVRPLAEW